MQDERDRSEDCQCEGHGHGTQTRRAQHRHRQEERGEATARAQRHDEHKGRVHLVGDTLGGDRFAGVCIQDSHRNVREGDPWGDLQQHDHEGKENGGHADLGQGSDLHHESGGGHHRSENERSGDRDPVLLRECQHGEGPNEQADANGNPAAGIPLGLHQAQRRCGGQEGDGVRESDAGGPGVLACHDRGGTGHKKRSHNTDRAVDVVEEGDILGLHRGDGVLRRGRQEDGGNEDQCGRGQRGERASIVTRPRGGHSFDDLADGFCEVVVDHVGGTFTERFEYQRSTSTHSLRGQGLRLIEETTRRGTHGETIVCGLITESANGFNESGQELHQWNRLRDRHIGPIHAKGDREWNQRHSTRCFRCHWILPVAA